jgi:sporulation protein YlmC with PRC-barrel domain
MEHIMVKKEKLTLFHQVHVVAFEEGLLMGRVLDIYIDRQAKRIQGISFKAGLWDTEKPSYIDRAEIMKIGREVVIVTRQKAAKPLSVEMAENSLRKLKGFKITTREGAFIGELADLNVNSEDGQITDLILAENRGLEVDTDEIVLGPDVIVVPESYAARINPLEGEKTGVLMHLAGTAGVPDSFRDKYEELKLLVRDAKGSQKMVETLKSGSEMTRETVRRTSQKLRETLEQIRKKREGEIGTIKEEEAEYQGSEAEHAGRTYYESDLDRIRRPEYRASEAGYSDDAGPLVEEGGKKEE